MPAAPKALDKGMDESSHTFSWGIEKELAVAAFSCRMVRINMFAINSREDTP
jgi:hypothetical protein